MAYVIPCRHISEWQKIFGFPFGWFTVYNDTISDVILKSTLVNPIMFFANVIIWCLMLFLTAKAYGKIKNGVAAHKDVEKEQTKEGTPDVRAAQE